MGAVLGSLLPRVPTTYRVQYWPEQRKEPPFCTRLCTPGSAGSNELAGPCGLRVTAASCRKHPRRRLGRQGIFLALDLALRAFRVPPVDFALSAGWRVMMASAASLVARTAPRRTLCGDVTGLVAFPGRSPRCLAQDLFTLGRREVSSLERMPAMDCPELLTCRISRGRNNLLPSLLAD